MIYRSAIKREEKGTGDSKILTVLITLYMASVLLFSSNTVLNTISQVLFLMSIGGCAIYMMMHSKNFKIDRFLEILAFFVLFCFISTIWAEDRSLAISRVLTLCQLFLMSLVFTSYMSNYENVDKMLKGFIISGVLCSLSIIGYYGINEYIRLMMLGVRLGGGINNENTIGLYTSTTAVMCFYFAYCKKEKLFYIVMLLPFFVAMGSGSRKALALVVFGAFAIILIQYRRETKLSGFVKLVAAISVLVIAVKVMSKMEIFDVMFSRFETMFSSTKKDNSTLTREAMIEYGLDYFKQYPYTGIGVGNSGIITKNNLGWATYLHNNYVELLATVGIFGTILYYAIYVYLIVDLYKLAFQENDDTAVLMLSLMVSNLIMDYGAVSYYTKTMYIYFSLASATISIGKRRTTKNEELLLENEEGD